MDGLGIEGASFFGTLARSLGFAVAPGAGDLRVVWDRRENAGVSRGSRAPDATANPGVLTVIPNNAETPRTQHHGDRRSTRE
jgi:hypothetical protein